MKKFFTLIAAALFGMSVSAQTWDFTVIPTQTVDGTGNLRSAVGDHINDDGGESWSAYFNAGGVKDEEQFTVKAGELFEQTKGLTFGILDNDKMVLYRNYPTNYGGCHLYFNKDVDLTIPAKKGQVIEFVLTSAKDNKVCTSMSIAESGIEVPKSNGSSDITGYAPVTCTVTEDNPIFTMKSAVYVQKITVKAGEAAFNGIKWDFTKWSDATVAALKADAAASKTEGWSDVEKKADAEADGAPTDLSKENCFWFTGTSNADGTLSANGVVIEELKGLVFDNADYLAARSLAIAVNYKLANADESKAFGPYNGPSYLWLGGKEKKCFTIPAVAAGATITIEAESHKITDARGIQLKQGETQIGEDFKPTTFASQTFTIANAGDVEVWNTNGCHIYTITVTNPGGSEPVAEEKLVATLDATTNTGGNDGAKWNFADGYTITNELGNRNYSDDGKYMTIGKVTASQPRFHKINVPADVTVTAIEVEGYVNNGEGYSYLWKINDKEYDVFGEDGTDIVVNKAAKYGFTHFRDEKDESGNQKVDIHKIAIENPTAGGSLNIGFTGTNAVRVLFRLYSGGTTGIEEVRTVRINPANNVMYNLAGQKVGSDYKGIVIMNGKKFMKF